MISEYVYMTIVLTVICLILQQEQYTWMVRLSAAIAFISVFYYILNYYESTSAGDINQITWKEGMVISYAYRSLSNILDGMFFMRLLGIQYIHSGLIVRDPSDNRLKVLEWRQYNKDFSPNIKHLQKNSGDIGHVLVIPIDEYVKEISESEVIFKIYHPPPSINRVELNEQLVRTIQDEGIIYCTLLVCRYLIKLGYVSEPPVFKNHLIYYYPHTCAVWFRYHGWKDNIYVKK